MDKKILDVTCGNRGMWFQKNEPHTVYCDKRREVHEGKHGNELRKDGQQSTRRLVIDPDIQCDFTALPFDDESFSLVVFDPPHIDHASEASWDRAEYGCLEGDWRTMLRDGFRECMRVLKPDGVLIFKWSETQFATREIINLFGQEPLFGHRSGKKMNTNWLCYMKFGDDAP